MQLVYDRAEYIRLRVEVMSRPARGKRTPWTPRADQCRCGRPRDSARRRCATCRASERAAYRDRVADGVCAQARSHGLADPGSKLCAACREFFRAQTAAAKAKAKAR